MYSFSARSGMRNRCIEQTCPNFVFCGLGRSQRDHLLNGETQAQRMKLNLILLNLFCNCAEQDFKLYYNQWHQSGNNYLYFWVLSFCIYFIDCGWKYLDITSGRLRLLTGFIMLLLSRCGKGVSKKRLNFDRKWYFILHFVNTKRKYVSF